ncbi:CMP-N-acetylneuraminic acid synthetase [Petrocella atlantisensis]|uniref:CMP-N-acetylneuraminic acid synthetase n=1 Tax=Petrocella atlantisensis TaxID=2173034 RepID=A0A3P7S9F1_9FIRM|nr:acylneuraminate cytidylyltransferase family protein [Petrocella atlantisensis]VDN48549.1 CMP-N-acetylneuraminic acid synthetase [Petrocella atlantisensis]
MKILFTICGRAGSKGLKNKNLKEFLGYPLPFYTISAIDLYLKNSPEIKADIVLNTDSEQLIKMFDDGIKKEIDVIKREQALGMDHIPKTAVILDCLKRMQIKYETNYDMVVDLDITSPLRRTRDIKNLIEKKHTYSTDVVFSVTNARRNPYFNMVRKSENGYERVMNSTFNTRQEAPDIYDMNASLYAYSPEFLESEKGLFEGYCEVIHMQDTAVLDIDHENDFELMQVVGKYLFDKEESFNEVRNNIRNISIK